MSFCSLFYFQFYFIFSVHILLTSVCVCVSRRVSLSPSLCVLVIAMIKTYCNDDDEQMYFFSSFINFRAFEVNEWPRKIIYVFHIFHFFFLSIFLCALFFLNFVRFRFWIWFECTLFFFFFSTLWFHKADTRYGVLCVCVTDWLCVHFIIRSHLTHRVWRMAYKHARVHMNSRHDEWYRVFECLPLSIIIIFFNIIWLDKNDNRANFYKTTMCRYIVNNCPRACMCVPCTVTN